MAEKTTPVPSSKAGGTPSILRLRFSWLVDEDGVEVDVEAEALFGVAVLSEVVVSVLTPSVGVVRVVVGTLGTGRVPMASFCQALRPARQVRNIVIEG